MIFLESGLLDHFHNFKYISTKWAQNTKHPLSVVVSTYLPCKSMGSLYYLCYRLHHNQGTQLLRQIACINILSLYYLPLILNFRNGRCKFHMKQRGSLFCMCRVVQCKCPHICMSTGCKVYWETEWWWRVSFPKLNCRYF